ncbi:DUF1189 domain-containing protein [Metabacillus lacus]|nr:DUF1189 domain-containing protein [Metabacillus lacus]
MNVFQQFAKSTYSPKHISMFRFQGIGKTILFVFLLSILAALPAAINLATGIQQGLAGLDTAVEEELPDFTIANGTLTSEDNQSVEFKKDDFFIVFDPTGSFTEEELQAKRNSVGLLQEEFVLVINGQAQTYSYSLVNGPLSKGDILEYMDGFKSLFPIFISVFIFFIYLFTAAAKFIEITLLAAIGLLIKNIMQKNLNFKQLWVMSAYSVTLATVFFAVMDLLHANVPSALMINWFIHFMILYMAVKEVPGRKKLA